MSLTCPKCGGALSIFELQREPYPCPHCQTKIRSRVPSVTYILFRLLAGGIAMWVASPFEDCAVCFYLLMIFVILGIAYVVIQYATDVEICNEEDSQ